MLDNLVWEIYVQSTFVDGEAGINRAVVPSKFPVRGKVKDLASRPVIGLLPDCIDVIGAGLVEPALAIGLGVLVQTGSKSGRRQVINTSLR